MIVAPIDAFHGFGILSLLMLAVGLLALVLHWPAGIHKSFSQHAVVDQRATVFYIVLFVISLVPFNLFLWLWFVPYFSVHWTFLLFVTAASGLQIAATLVPEKGKRIKAHRLFAGLSALLLLPSIYVLSLAEGLGYDNQLITASSLVAMLILTTVVIYFRGKPRYFLLLQIAYFALFFLPIVLASYS